MEYDNDLVREAWLNFKTGDLTAARRYAERALLVVDDTETKVKASFILSQVTDDPKEKRDLLETVLGYDPTHAEARRALAILDGKLNPADIVNADNLPAQATDPQNAQADRFTCPKCGARRVFAPDGKSLVCEHCGYNDSLANNQRADEQDFFTAMATAKGHRTPVATQVFHCQGCGAEFVLAPDVISVTCAYCDSPHVVRLEESRELIEPEGILPHALTQRQAVQALVKWVEQNKWKPERKVEIPRGAYIPAWTFDLGGAIHYTGYMTQPSSNPWDRSRQPVVKVSEDEPVMVDNLLVPASKKMKALFNGLLSTFDLSALQPYDARFLAGWPAEIYNTPMAEASLEARSQAFADYSQRIQLKYEHLQDLSMSSAGMAVLSFKLVLLPVWMTKIAITGETRSILINGQSGKIMK